jgi:ATP-binding cassette subfamily F protein 3
MLFHALASGEVRDFPLTLSTHHMQEMPMHPEADNVSVMGTVLASHPMRRVLMCMEPTIQAKIDDETTHEAAQDGVEGLKKNLAMVQLLLQQISAHDGEERASKMLAVLGFDKVGEAAPMSSLSGGLRMRVALASAFFINPDVLLLDEPTNHLDLPSVLWLENKLRSYQGSFLLVTHDRHLLENVVTSVMRLQDMEIKPFKMGFAGFEKEIVKLDQDREKMINAFLMKNRNIDPMSPAYRTKMSYQEWQTKRSQRMVSMQGKFTFQAPKKLPNPTNLPAREIPLIKVDNVTFSYEPSTLPFIFKAPISYEITMGTRVGIMGPNGAGKSTLLKLLTGKIFPTTGTITTNKDFVLAYFGQHSTKELDMDESAIEFMTRSFPDANVGEIKSHLERTSVDSGTQQKRMLGLSFSQRSCVIFAKLTFVPPHLLIMDEPTNFLDLDSVDSLILAANKFADAGGALITVTHNRDFLKRTSNKFLSITPGAFLEYESVKDAERATYSFIAALERGEEVDHKTAIQDNRGGGAIHTEEYLAAKAAALKKLTKDASKLKLREAEEKAAEELVLATRAAKAADRKSKEKTDWVKDESAWAPVKSKNGTTWTLCKVVRNIPGMGVTLEVPGSAKPVLMEAKKLKTENPEGAGGAAPAPAGRPTTAPVGGARGGGAPRGGARGGGAPPRGGARGGGRGK